MTQLKRVAGSYAQEPQQLSRQVQELERVLQETFVASDQEQKDLESRISEVEGTTLALSEQLGAATQLLPPFPFAAFPFASFRLDGTIASGQLATLVGIEGTSVGANVTQLVAPIAGQYQFTMGSQGVLIDGAGPFRWVRVVIEVDSVPVTYLKAIRWSPAFTDPLALAGGALLHLLPGSIVTFRVVTSDGSTATFTDSVSEPARSSVHWARP